MAVDLSQVHQTPTFVTFSEDFKQNDYLLVELSKDILDDMRIGELLYIKGKKSENASLCTQSHSSLLQRVSTSNTVLICEDNRDNIHNNVNVKGQVTSQIELITNPLDPSSVFSNIYNYSEKKGTSLKELWLNTLYSEKQLLSLLESCIHCIHNSQNEWFLLSHSDVYHYYQSLYSFLTSNNMSLELFDKDIYLNSLEEDEKLIQLQLFPFFTIMKENELSSLNPIEISKIIARHYFITTNEWIPCEEFMNYMHTEVPAIFDVTEDFLNDIAVCTIQNGQKGYLFIDTFTLPTIPKDRYMYLFNIQEEWDPVILSYFVKDLETWGYGKIHDMNVKYCREVKLFKSEQENAKVLVLKK